jgi:hypothetical protein
MASTTFLTSTGLSKSSSEVFCFPFLFIITHSHSHPHSHVQLERGMLDMFLLELMEHFGIDGALSGSAAASLEEGL